MTSVLKVLNNVESQRGNKIVNVYHFFNTYILFTLPALCYKHTEIRDQGRPTVCSRNLWSWSRQHLLCKIGSTALRHNIFLFFTFMWPCIVTNFFVIKPTRYTNFTDLFCHETLTCFGQFVCLSSGVYSLYTQQWYMSYRHCTHSFRAGPGWKCSSILVLLESCWVYSE
jgi:hypothetical protein